MKKLVLPLLVLNLAAAALFGSGAARAAKPVPTIAIAEIQPDTSAVAAGTACLFDVAYTIDGLKGSPAKTWTVWVSDGSDSAEVAIVTKSADGLVAHATPGEMYAPKFTYPLDGSSHTYTLELLDGSASVVIARSAPMTATCAAGAA
jgi:hypothetical protein